MNGRAAEKWLQVVVLGLALLVAGCGGGSGGNGDSDVPATATDRAEEAAVLDAAHGEDETELLVPKSVAQAGAAHYARLNEVRKAMGLGQLRWSGALAAAAQSHASYLALHRMSGHEEVPGSTGFTGEYIADRTGAHGYRGKLVQETKAGGQSLTAQQGRARMDDLLQAPMHRLQLLAPEFDDAGVGVGADGSPIVTNLGASGGRLRTSLRRWMYPYAGQQGLPVDFRPGTEAGLPEDLPALTGTPLTLGGFLFSIVTYSSASLVEEGTGREVPLVATSRPGQMRAALVFFPAEPLRPATHYTWRITATVDRITATTVAKFVTAAAAPQ